ncbi:hypothetical protein A8C32_09025 [Flavivirga aquatica]|uniref:DUF5723 domain-containing protein n=1 Tax=Flavivirga aquatica TaxID=1849968 RepID=A0A1E5SJK3_9FLAO|nr:DUF5723 family protein [Flavivirga aquatica]OEJ99298.1 hypothetical protein A8C32_09025 [Flavivirga aquatica]
MKIAPFLLIFFTGLSFSQNKQLLYGFSEIPQSLLLNPGGKISENKGYFGIPLLSHLHLNIGSSGVSAYDLFADDGIDFNTKLENVVNNMKPEDFFTATQQLEIFSGGFEFGNTHEKSEYLSFGLYQELDFIAYFPKDYAILALEGNQSNINKPFKLDHLSLSADVLSVFHVGYNKKVNSKFTYGVRGKIYSSIANINSVKNKGSFITVPGQNNIYNHVFDLDLEARTSGIASLVDDNSEEDYDENENIKTIRKRLMFGGNLGLGMDLGFTYQITDQLTFDSSLLDIGFIRHSKDVESYKVKDRFVFEGVDPLIVPTEQGQTADEYWTDIEEEFEDLFTVDTTATKYTTWRPVKFNASLNYAFGEKLSEDCNCIMEDSPYLNAVGAQLYAIKRPKSPQLALTAYYYRRLFNGLRVKATYTIDSYSFNNIGLGLSAHLGGANFYLMADNFIEYRNVYNVQSVSLQFGFNYIFNKNED